MATKKITFTIKNSQEARALWNALFYGVDQLEQMANNKDPLFNEERESFKIAKEKRFAEQTWEKWYKMHGEELNQKGGE